MNYTCPICGFDGLDSPPIDFEICPSCGTEFGYDDDEHTNLELTLEWIRNGMQWWSRNVPVSDNWKPVEQVKRILEPYDLIRVTRSTEALFLHGQFVRGINQNNAVVIDDIEANIPVLPTSISSSKFAVATA